MKRVSDNDDEPDFPLRFGVNVLVYVKGLPDFPDSFTRTWLEALLVSGEDAQGRFCVVIKDVQYVIERDRIQRKDTTVRPSAAGENVLVFLHTSDGVQWREGVVLTFLSYDMSDTYAVRKCEVLVNVGATTATGSYPVNTCILGRHYVEMPEKKKRIKQLL